MPRLHPHPCGLHALGLLCLAGAAAAQAPTSVTLFGVMAVSYTHLTLPTIYSV